LDASSCILTGVSKSSIWFMGIWVASWMMAAEPERSVIQINTFSQQPIWDEPWRFDSVRRSSGSGFVIRGKRILTNAHVVSWARQILVRRYQDPRPYVAHVDFIGHDCDLALLDVDDPLFFDGLEPLELGELAAVRSTVVTYGYPAGGEQISYARGVVSRVEMQSYTHIGNRSLLAVQTDAAINPGNSGGPVMQEDRVAGVAFQNMPGLENTGFFIPPPVIRHFLKDIEDGHYDGFPSVGIRMSALQNPDYRRYLQLPEGNTGARVDSLYPGSAAGDVLRPEDVLMRIGTYPVGSDGTIIYQGNRVHAAVAFQELQTGGAMPVELWRSGQLLSTSVSVSVNLQDRAEGNQYTLPKYYILGGLVFTPLSRDYLRASGLLGASITGADLAYELFYRRQEKPDTWRPEPVVLAAILSHPVNANWTIRAKTLVDSVNGVRIEKMDDLIQAFAHPAAAYDMIQFTTQHSFECLNHAEAVQATPDILKTYGVSSDRRL
jgi:S1-C subfamily serine protease